MFLNIKNLVSAILTSVVISMIFHTCKRYSYTFNEHIAPLVFENCVPCHREGGAAPFSLTDYKKVYRKRNTIAKVTSSGYMPPWPADRNYSHFIGERYLSLEQKKMISVWVKQGAPEGEGTPPAIPRFNPFSRIGIPDTTIFFDSILVRGNNRDLFLILSMPIELKRDRYVRAIEFVPNENNLVHHMNGHILNYHPSRKSDIHAGLRILNIEVEEETYRRQFDSLDLWNDDGSIPQRIHSAVNYLPGVEGTIYPEGIGGFTLNRYSKLIANDIHYGPIPQDKWDHSHINIFFSESPPLRPVKETMMGTNTKIKIEPPLVIPANTIRKFSCKMYVSEDISVLTINPHMHLLGKSFKAYALEPAGDTIRLISIPRWDFRWQYFYTFQKMLKIPEGSMICVEAEYDNTSANPNNPNDPPKLVAERLNRGGEGMRTTDEMLQFIITWLPYQKGDENISLQYRSK